MVVKHILMYLEQLIGTTKMVDVPEGNDAPAGREETSGAVAPAPEEVTESNDHESEEKNGPDEPSQEN